MASRPTQRARRDPLYAETADVACRHTAQDAVEDGLLELPFEVALLGQQFRAQPLDVETVLRLDGSVTVPNGSYSGVLVTSEYSPLELQTEQKYYAPGVGEVEETVVKGHHEEFQLVGITH